MKRDVINEHNLIDPHSPACPGENATAAWVSKERLQTWEATWKSQNPLKKAAQGIADSSWVESKRKEEEERDKEKN